MGDPMDWDNGYKGSFKAALQRERNKRQEEEEQKPKSRFSFRAISKRFSSRVQQTAQNISRKSFRRQETRSPEDMEKALTEQLEHMNGVRRPQSFSGSGVRRRVSLSSRSRLDASDAPPVKKEFNFLAPFMVKRGQGSDNPNAHRYLKRPREAYRIYPGRVDLLVALMNAYSSGDWIFVTGRFHVRCSASFTIGGPTFLHRLAKDDTKKRDNKSVLRMYDVKQYPKQIPDYYSAACVEAEFNEAEGKVVFDPFIDMVPLTNKIVVNTLNLGVARAADYIYQLYLSEGSFDIANGIPTGDSRCMRFARNVAELLIAVLNVPAVFPVAHLGVFSEEQLDESDPISGSGNLYSPMLPAVSQIKTGSLAKDKKIAELLGAPFTVVEDMPRSDLEEAIFREIEYMEEDHLDRPKKGLVKSDTLLLYSPLFEYYVAGARFPDPNTDFNLALSILLNTPVVDRLGIFTAQKLRVALLEPMPENVEDEPLLPRQGEIKDRLRNKHGKEKKKGKAGSRDGSTTSQESDGTYSSSTLGRLVTNAQNSGLTNLFRKTAKEALKRAKSLDCLSIQLLWDGRPASTAALLGMLSIGPEIYRKNRLTLKVVFLAEAIQRFEAFYNAYLAPGPRGNWEGILEPHLWEAEHRRRGGYREEDSANLESEYTEAISSKLLLADIMDLENNFVITAEHAEAIFGTTQDLFPLEKKHENDSWEVLVRKRIVDMNLLKEGVREVFLKKLKGHAEAAPFEIKTIRDFTWWMNITCRWQFNSLRMLLNKQDMNSELASRLFHFYAGEGWQTWALNPKYHQLKYSLISSKHSRFSTHALLKAYVYDAATPAIDPGACLAYFLKEDETGNTANCRNSFAFFALDDQFHPLHFGANSHVMEDLCEIFGDSLQAFLL